MAGSGLDRATLVNLDEGVEVDMVTPRRDGSLSIGGSTTDHTTAGPARSEA
jgi:hypothetical protein